MAETVYWGLYHEKLGWWLDRAPNWDREHVSPVVYYPAKEIASAHWHQVLRHYGAEYASEWRVRSFDDDSKEP